jgi:putative transposase
MNGMSKQLNFDDPDSAIALFRYGLIANLVHEPVTSGKLEEALRQIAARTYNIPHSRRVRVSLSSVRRYLKAYQKGGFDALKPRERSDAGAPRVFDRMVLDLAVSLREAQPGRTTPMIAEHLKRDGIHVNPHTLDTYLRKLGKTRRMLDTDPKIRRRFEREHTNSLWQGDTLQGPWLPDPERPNLRRRAHLCCFIDDHSRMIVYGEWFFDEQLPRLERVLKIAILRRGLPKALYVDNGKIFHAVQFGAACASLGINKIHAQPYDPEAKGKIERFFSTVRAQFLPEVEASGITTLDVLNQSFLAWLDQIYHARVHTETEQSPFERFTSGLDADTVRIPDQEALRQAFLWRATRKVSKLSTIELQGNTYSVDLRLGRRGQTIELRFDPFDLSRLDIYQHNKLIAPVDLVHQKNQYHLQIMQLVPEYLRSHADPNAGRAFLAQLCAEHDEALRKQIGIIKFSNLDQNSSAK